MSIGTRDYKNDDITIHWDTSLCSHAAECISCAPTVFDPQARPWVNVDGASADVIQQAIDRYPSSALSYTRHDRSDSIEEVMTPHVLTAPT